jgi:uncharacterized protein
MALSRWCGRMFESLAQKLTRFSVKKPWSVTLFFAILFALGALASTRLELRLNYMELLPANSPMVQDLKWVAKKAGTEGYLVVAVSGGTREERLAFAPGLVESLEALDEVRYAEFGNDTPFFRKNAGALLPLGDLKKIATDLEAKIQEGVEGSMDLGLDDEAPKSKEISDSEVEKIFADYDKALPAEVFESKAQDELYVMAKPALQTMGVDDVTRLIENVEKSAKEAVKKSGKNFQIGLGGPAVFVRAFNEGTQKDLGIISSLAIGLALSLLVFATRRPLASLFIFVPIAGAISCALGVAAFTIGHLNIISSLLVAILLGLGVEFGIHLILRTNEARVNLPLEEAVLEAVPETMAGAFSGAITNSAAFLVLIFASFSAYRQFGFIAAVGILLSWLFTYTLLPALIVVTERAFPGSVIRAGRERETTFLPPRAFSWLIAIALPLAGIVGAWALPKVGIERSFSALNGNVVPDPVGNRASSSMQTTMTPAFIWVSSIEHARTLETIFADIKREDKNPRGSIIDGTVSLARALVTDWPERREVLQRIKKSIRKLPDSIWDKHRARLLEFETAASASELTVEMLPESVRRKFAPLDNDGTFVLFTPSRSVDDARELDDYVEKMEMAAARAEKAGVRTRIMSENRIAVHIFRQVFADAPFIAWSATLVALGVLFLLLRNVRETLIVFAPLSLGMLTMVLGMYLLGVKLNFINMCVIPSIFTVAIDNAVHLYHRYQKDGKAAMPSILGNTGVAVLMASLVNASGYAPMLLARFFGMKSLGIVASLGMFGMVLATVAWFPAVLILMPERWLRGSRASVAPKGEAVPAE